MTLKVILTVFALVAFIGLLSYGLGWFSEGGRVAQREFGPEAFLRKYEWFKNAAAELDRKRADIEVFQARLSNLETQYVGVSRREWPRDEREQYNQWVAELTGLKSSYNGLAAEYNSQMAKFNWRFTNAGDLPEGATEPLPREFAPYRVQ